MSCPSIRRFVFLLVSVCGVLTAFPIAAEQQTAESAAQRSSENSPARQAKLEAALSKMLSGATLEGSFTSTSAGSDPTKLSREKYSLGDVKKVSGDLWQIPARIQYGEKDFELPITLPIRWAGDTPIVTVDELSLPGFGTVSARVMFFANHYAGYWKHGDHGGHLFGVIHPAEAKSPAFNATPSSPADSAPPSRVRAKAAGDK